MEPLWIILAVAVGAGGVLYFRRPRQAPAPTVKLDIREERLARQLARTVGSTLQAVLPSVRFEIDLAPHLADEIILKRAKYHFQQNQPEQQCSVWIDRKVG